MPVDLRPIIEPAHTAVLVIECQEGVLGENSPVRELARVVREGSLIPTLARFLGDARAAGVRVYHCTVEAGANDAIANTPLGARTRGRSDGAGAILRELGPEPHDVVAPRDHGLTVFHDTGLDDRLRSAGIRSVVLTGVSVNIAITGAAIEACVAGFPLAFASDALRYSLRNLAYLSTADAIRAVWAPG